MNMFQFFQNIGLKLAAGISSLLIGLAGIIAPVPKDIVIAPIATSTAEISVNMPTSTVKTSVSTNKNITPTQLNTPKPTFVEVPVTPQVPVKNVPTILSFDVSPRSASYGEDLTFSWTAQNAVKCMVPVTDPSSVEIPFTGRLPQGSATYKIADATGTAKTMTFWLVCADKDWVTVTAKTSAQLLAPRLSGIPYAENDGTGKRYVYVKIIGAPKVRITCVVATYNGSNPPNVVDALVYPDELNIASAPIPETLIAGLPLSCVAKFNTGIEEQFLVNTPTR
jgi:hypothetical protein